MIFNTVTFIVFLILVFSLYWGLNRRWQNALLLVASYVFYGWWDWRFLSLILISSLFDFWLGRRIAATSAPRRRKAYIVLSLVSNLGLLGFFKYFNFFAESFAHLLAGFGLEAGFVTLHIILPVGISFYTFQSLSYTLDVYRGQCLATYTLVEFMAFVSFFPQLVAGPIERATNLLKQFAGDRVFDVQQAKDGVRQMLWGFFQKMVIADGAAKYVNAVYAADAEANGGRLLLGTVFFAFQIYSDFAGYANIACGCARLFGFRLMRNFAYPYFSRNIAEFWQRWHISLSTWFRDYLYIPLGGSRRGLARTARNVLLTFTISGLWHGANWTYVFWGLLNGLYFLPGLLRRRLGPAPVAPPSRDARWTDLPAIGLTFLMTCAAWVFFRAESLPQAFHFFRAMAGAFDLHALVFDAPQIKLLILAMLAIEWIQRHRAHPLDIAALPLPVRWASYYALASVILVFGTFQSTTFIYFQF
ncbi:MAG: MBOAT family protein [Opitutae bacterium]|nr:MBOAT family protein [Opitutae bacterium]